MHGQQMGWQDTQGSAPVHRMGRARRVPCGLGGPVLIGWPGCQMVAGVDVRVGLTGGGWRRSCGQEKKLFICYYYHHQHADFFLCGRIEKKKDHILYSYLKIKKLRTMYILVIKFSDFFSP